VTAEGNARKALTVRLALIQQIATGNTLAIDAQADVQRFVETILRQPAEQDSHEDRLLLAGASSAICFSLAAPSSASVALAERAWGDGALLREETAKGAPLYMVTGALNWSDSWPLATRILDAAVDQARANGWTHDLATAAYCRGYVHWRAGAARQALDDLLLAQHLRSFGWEAYTALLVAVLVEVQEAYGDLAALRELEAELHELTSLDEKVLLGIVQSGLGRAALAGGRAQDAVEHFDRAGLTLQGATANPAQVMWQGYRALALHELGRTAEARADAAANLRCAEKWGAPRCLTDALRIVALVAPDEQREGLLRRALAASDTPAYRGIRERQLVAVALAELLTDGEQARALAQEAYAYADGEGLRPLRERATAVLRRTGQQVSPAPADGLTASERRVAELAASGMSNRQLAEHLYVTVKAVEWHLSAAYKKLGISGRRQLTHALGLTEPAAAPPAAGE
jgi:DNA-binding CsgD family transcriptional regulator